MEKVALVFAGGSGQRMGANIPKQFLKVHGKEIIIHTLELFENYSEIDEIYVVCIKEWIPFFNNLIKKFAFKKISNVIPGGETGQESIYLGLKEIEKKYKNCIVLIHDGVRPLVSQKTIEDCIKCTLKNKNAITVSQCYETPIISNDGMFVNEMMPRENVFTAQAPQCFLLRDILGIHEKERQRNPGYNGIVDSCGLMYKHGIKCYLVKGNRGNIKVTTPEDYCTLLGNYTAEDYKQLLDLKNS